MQEEWKQRPPLRWWAVAYFNYKPPSPKLDSELYSDKLDPSNNQFPRTLLPTSPPTVPGPDSGVAAIASMVRNAPGGVIRYTQRG